VLRPGGHLIVLNYSYRGDLAVDDVEVRRLAAAHGFQVVEGAVRPFRLWDGVGWVMRSTE
jgi:hypothetical protein